MFKMNHNPTISDNPVLDAALDHALVGHAVIPLWSARRLFGNNTPITCTCWRGVDCDHPGKHPCTRNGVHDATRDERVIRAWFTGRNDLNLGVVGGSASGGLLILDKDRRKGGHKTLAQLERKYGQVPRSAVVVTRDGEHIYLQSPPGVLIASRADVLGSGLDIKCEGGYVVGAGSHHFSGHQYYWRDGKMPRRFPRAPQWLITLAQNGSARVNASGRSSSAPGILTKDHPAGQAIAKLIGAKDCKHYWRLNCPCHGDEHPSAAMYPRPNGRVFVTCFAGCSHADIARAILEMAR